METATTHGVEVSVESFYLPDHSAPEENRYVFAYRIRLKNHSEVMVKLLRRHWIITDSNGEVNEVKGVGVVGEQPILTPGGEYEYTSGSHLKSPMGTMHGTYEMLTHTAENIEVTIPCFSLEVPGVLN